MSKKSRKRNKKILAAIGIGLGAAALASKKKAASASDVEANDNAFRINDKKPSIADVSGAKKSTTKPAKKNIPQSTKVNTGSKDIPGIKVGAKDGKTNYIKASKGDKTAPNKEFKGPDAKYDYKNRAAEKNTAGIAKPKKSLMASAFPKSSAADNYKAATQDYNRGNYKSGGSVKKSMGKALRGGGKVIR